MKFTVQMKDPDCLADSIEQAVREELFATMPTLGDDEREELVNMRCAKASRVADEWFKFSEYLSVEIDTEARTCIVLKARAA